MSQRLGFFTLRWTVTIWFSPAAMVSSPAPWVTVAPPASTMVVVSVTVAWSFPSLRTSVLT